MSNFYTLYCEKNIDTVFVMHPVDRVQISTDDALRFCKLRYREYVENINCFDELVMVGEAIKQVIKGILPADDTPLKVVIPSTIDCYKYAIFNSDISQACIALKTGEGALKLGLRVERIFPIINAYSGAYIYIRGRVQFHIKMHSTDSNINSQWSHIEESVRERLADKVKISAHNIFCIGGDFCNCQNR